MSGYNAFVAAAAGLVVGVNTATGQIFAEFSIDSPQGITATPDGSQLYVAQTGKYSVVVINLRTGAEQEITVGPFPQDVAATPDGTAVWATVTGGNTGPGGSDKVAVVSTATNTVTGYLTVGTNPRQVTFSPDGNLAYITTASSVDAVSTTSGLVVHRIPAPDGPQDLALSPDGGTLYVTNPVPGTLWVINTASRKVTANLFLGEQPYSVAVTPDGKTVYVTQMSANTVLALDAATLKRWRRSRSAACPAWSRSRPTGHRAGWETSSPATSASSARP